MYGFISASACFRAASFHKSLPHLVQRLCSRRPAVANQPARAGRLIQRRPGGPAWLGMKLSISGRSRTATRGADWPVNRLQAGDLRAYQPVDHRPAGRLALRAVAVRHESGWRRRSTPRSPHCAAETPCGAPPSPPSRGFAIANGIAQGNVVALGKNNGIGRARGLIAIDLHQCKPTPCG